MEGGTVEGGTVEGGTVEGLYPDAVNNRMPTIKVQPCTLKMRVVVLGTVD